MSYEHVKRWRSKNKVKNARMTYEDKARRIKRRAGLLTTIKERYGCAVCGYNRCGFAIDVHHIDTATKEATVAELINKNVGRERIVEEITKCILLCSNCHREHHAMNTVLPSRPDYDLSDFQ